MSQQKITLVPSILAIDSILFLRKKELLLIKGPLGTLFLKLPIEFQLKRLKSSLTYTYLKSLVYRTHVQLLKQKIRGVLFGFFEILVICGVG